MNTESILKCTANFRDYLLKDLAEPGFAKHYLEISLENYGKDGNIEILSQAIQDVIEAQGGIEKFAASTNGNLQYLSDAFDSENASRLDDLLDILSVLGFEIERNNLLSDDT